MVVHLLIVTILAPAAVAGVIAVGARLLPASSSARRAAALLAMVAGYTAGHLAVLGAPSFPPVDTTQGLFYLALALGALGLLGRRSALVWTLPAARSVAVVLMLGLTLHPLVRLQWTPGQSAVRLAALAIVSLASWWGYRALAARLPPGAVYAAWIAVFAGTATLLLLARTALLAQLASTVAVVLVVLAVVERGGNAVVGTTVALPFLAPMLHAFVLNGLFYAQLDAAPAAALALSPLAAAVALAVPRRSGPRWRAVVAVAGVVLLLAPFVARAAIGYLADDRGYHDYGE